MRYFSKELGRKFGCFGYIEGKCGGKKGQNSKLTTEHTGKSLMWKICFCKLYVYSTTFCLLGIVSNLKINIWIIFQKSQNFSYLTGNLNDLESRKKIINIIKKQELYFNDWIKPSLTCWINSIRYNLRFVSLNFRVNELFLVVCEECSIARKRHNFNRSKILWGSRVRRDLILNILETLHNNVWEQ